MAVVYRDFELRPQERLLLVRGQPVQIGARAFDLLVALAERSDRVVGKHELLDVVWPKLVVEENNLQVQIHTLRKLLGPSVITTVPGRGYRFTAEQSVHADRSRPPAAAAAYEDSSSAGAALDSEGNVPDHVPPLIGRDAALDTVREMVLTDRLVTVTGAGGIGKTRLAQAAAHLLRGKYRDGVWMVELAATSDGEQVVPSVAQALGVQLAGRRTPVLELAVALRSQSLLLVLDNCEHVVEAVGHLVSHLLAGARDVHMLVTSQELLKVVEEKVFKLEPLAVPQENDEQDPAAFGAVTLFIERAQAMDRNFSLDPRNVGAVVDICRKLDGIPLAIELAAARVPALGVYALHERLGERLRMLTGGARVSLRRHQTLRAAVDWSHNLLDDDERKVFRRLAVFSDGFSVEGAQLVCADAQIDEWSVLDILNALVDKSLVQVDRSMRPRYRFLESTRAYAMEKLAEADETNAFLQRHAESMRAVCDMAAKRRDIDWMWSEMNNVRVAYAWATGPGRNPLLAIGLATTSAMVLAVSGLVHEAMQRMLQLEPLITPSIPPDLAARFWQWLGRGGVEGRLPTSRCLQALSRAEGMFRQLGNERHVHACLRMRAEAMVASRDLAGAAEALAAAERMERSGGPQADRMRRFRVHAMLEAASGEHDASLARFQRAMKMAQSAGIQRYELILMADIARVHLDRQDFSQAAAQFQLLADKARAHPLQGLTRAQALVGLVAARVGNGQLSEAAAAASESAPLLLRCGLFLAHCDIYAWLLANMGQNAAAARLIGAADAFHRDSETTRDSVERLARAEVMKVLAVSTTPDQLGEWLGEGANGDQRTIVAVLEAAVSLAH